MNILLASGGDSGGNCYFIADALNKYTSHTARAIRMFQTYLAYPYDILSPSEEEIAHWVKWADVIHGRDFCTFLPPTDKPRIVTFSGRAWRRKPADLTVRWRDCGWLVTVSTLDMTCYVERDPPLWIPNPREKMGAGDNDKHLSFTVCQAPTFRERKGTDTVALALATAHIDFDLIERVSYLDCLKRKSRAHVLVDQFDYGYGNNAVEAWSLGIPVMSGAHNEKYVGAARALGSLPYVLTEKSQEDIIDKVCRLRDDDRFYTESVERGREWFYAHHHAPKVACKLAAVYESVL